jgi:hypothetical protein
MNTSPGHEGFDSSVGWVKEVNLGLGLAGAGGTMDGSMEGWMDGACMGLTTTLTFGLGISFWEGGFFSLLFVGKEWWMSGEGDEEGVWGLVLMEGRGEVGDAGPCSLLYGCEIGWQ